jgi:hypothetical protein
MNELVRMPGKAIAKPRKGSGLVTMNRALEDFAPALAISRRRRLQWEASICVIGIIGEPRSVDTAKKIHDGFLPALVEMDLAWQALWNVQSGHPAVDRATALSMLNVLFAAIGRRKTDEESAILLDAAADMLDPVNDVLDGIGGVEPINRHPLVLATAIKTLIATAKFTSCAELREAMAKVANSINNSVWHLEFMTERIHTADAMLFEKDRATWDAAYANVDSKMLLWMQEQLEMLGEGPSEDEDEDGNPEYPPSPRWLALEHLLKAKRVAAPPKPKRTAFIAAARAARKSGHTKRSKTTRQARAEAGRG